jgi:hypothetical protein
MKLAEAHNRVKDINERLTLLETRLSDCSLDSISSFIDEVNVLLEERQRLQNAISKTRSETLIAGSSLNFIYTTLDYVEDKLNLLTNLQNRKDLPTEVGDQVFGQLDVYSKLKSLLKNSIEKANWAIDVDITTTLGTGPQIRKGE